MEIWVEKSAPRAYCTALAFGVLFFYGWPLQGPILTAKGAAAVSYRWLSEGSACWPSRGPLLTVKGAAVAFTGGYPSVSHRNIISVLRIGYRPDQTSVEIGSEI